jgi:transposase
VAPDDVLASLRLLSDRREELCALRTQAVCRLHRLLAELTPGGLRRELTAGKAQALLARIRPGDDVARIRLQLESAVVPAVPHADTAIPRLPARGHSLILSPRRRVSAAPHRRRILVEMAQSPDRRQTL